MGAAIARVLARETTNTVEHPLTATQPDPGWYPDPAGSGGVRWWDGFGWTEHVDLPEAEVPGGEYVEVAAPAAQVLEDDGLLHPMAREAVFAGAPRGELIPLATRLKINPRAALTPRGLQVLGSIAMAILLTYLAVRWFGDAHGYRAAIALGIAVLLPIGTRLFIRLTIAQEFWWQWVGTRGFESINRRSYAERLPKLIESAPLVGPKELRCLDRLAVGSLAGRAAVLGQLTRWEQPEERWAMPATSRLTFVAMRLPDSVAAEWPGTSIRAEHHATRPIQMRALLGPIVPGAAPGGRAHVGAVATQHPSRPVELVDERFEAYFADRPLDADIIRGLLVVTREGAIATDEQLDELCRDALLLHSLLVAEHLAVNAAGAAAIPPPDDGVISRLVRPEPQEPPSADVGPDEHGMAA